MTEKTEDKKKKQPETASSDAKTNAENKPAAIERGGPKGPEPTRFGDWESNGRCTDF